METINNETVELLRPILEFDAVAAQYVDELEDDVDEGPGGVEAQLLSQWTELMLEYHRRNWPAAPVKVHRGGL